MPEPTTTVTEAEFEVLLRRAGLALDPAERAAIHAVWGKVEALRAQVRILALAPSPGAGEVAAAAAEPATTFAAQGPRA